MWISSNRTSIQRIEKSFCRKFQDRLDSSGLTYLREKSLEYPRKNLDNLKQLIHYFDLFKTQQFKTSSIDIKLLFLEHKSFLVVKKQLSIQNNLKVIWSQTNNCSFSVFALSLSCVRQCRIFLSREHIVFCPFCLNTNKAYIEQKNSVKKQQLN